MAWKPGESGNPKGRPKKGETFTDIIEQELKTARRHRGKDVSRKRLLVRKMIDRGIDGDTVSGKYIMDRMDGRPVQKHEVKGDLVGLPNKIQIEIVDPKSGKRRRSKSSNK
jgi:hypothetical protein